MGARPVWDSYSGKVKGVEVIPLAERTFPRIDVTVRASGFFRDAFPNLMELIDQATRMIAALDEPAEFNPLARNVAVDRAEMIKAGLSPEEADKRAAFRVFSDKPGTYGAGVADLIDSGKWQTADDLGDIYIDWGGYAYAKGTYGDSRQEDFRKRMGNSGPDVEERGHPRIRLFSCVDFNAYHGGITRR